MPFAAAFAALIGIAFQRATLLLRARCKTLSQFPRWLQPLAGGLTTWVVGISVFAFTGRLGVFALGYGDLSDALLHGMAWRIAFVLLAGKLVATIASYGFGGCGGIFSPNLFLGAMAGISIAGLGGKIVPLNRSDELLLAIGGMSACLGAVVQAPVTAILIIFEMTHQFAVVPGLMLAGLVSQALARTLQRHNFYDEVLLQDGHKIEHLIPPRDLRSWQNLPVSTIANFEPVVVSDISETRLRGLLEQHPYRSFPVVENGALKEIAVRSEIQRALAESRSPRLEPARTCTPNESIRGSQREIIESTTGTIAIVGNEDGQLLAFLTLHDLLRAQVSMGEREGST